MHVNHTVYIMPDVNPTPSPQLLKEIRAGFVLQGRSFTGFCREHGLTRQNVAKALTGEWKGAKASRIIRLVHEAATRDVAA